MGRVFCQLLRVLSNMQDSEVKTISSYSVINVGLKVEMGRR